ncbi:MAG: putative membrane protein YphA (DoxX/SURF4 family) [Planctomycetota bacterium]|jgi:uncharacterized membrane protein YphA (DoxX/SURF4 family)
MSSPASSSARKGWSLVIVRITVALLLLTEGWSAIQVGVPDGGDLESSISERLDEHSSLLAWWGETVLLANPDGTAFLWRWGLFLFGFLLTLGALTRPAGFLAAFLMLNAWAYGPIEMSDAFLLAAACCLAASISSAGRQMGLDSIFDQHFPSWLTWVHRDRSPFA